MAVRCFRFVFVEGDDRTFYENTNEAAALDELVGVGWDKSMAGVEMLHGKVDGGVSSFMVFAQGAIVDIVDCWWRRHGLRFLAVPRRVGWWRNRIVLNETAWLLELASSLPSEKRDSIREKKRKITWHVCESAI